MKIEESEDWASILHSRLYFSKELECWNSLTRKRQDLIEILQPDFGARVDTQLKKRAENYLRNTSQERQAKYTGAQSAKNSSRLPAIRESVK